MKLPCSVTRDLLPLYAEKLVEEETEGLIREHLADCPACRQKLSEIEVQAVHPVETAKPLTALKKEISKRRWYTAIIAALCVFVVVFTYFSHQNVMQLVPWQDGLIEVVGTETRPYEDVFGKQEPGNIEDPSVEVLVLQVDSRINGYREFMFKDEDGKTTQLLEGWSWNSDLSQFNGARDYTENILCPVPDRVIYSAGNQQKLLWGEPLNGGVELLPRLALGYYVILALGAALVSGIAWLLLRKRKYSWVPRQIFFAPISYLVAHFLIKGLRTASYFMERDFLSILVIAAALYTLLTLGWQIWSHRK